MLTGAERNVSEICAVGKTWKRQPVWMVRSQSHHRLAGSGGDGVRYAVGRMLRINRVFFFTLVLALAASAAWPAPAEASMDEPTLRFSIAPIEGQPWRFEWTVTSLEAQEVAYDRRLIEFTLRIPREGRRPRLITCRHPDTPRRRPEAKTMSAGESHSEWVDLRMYCWGNGLRALRNGDAEITTMVGFRSAGRGRFLARQEGQRRPLRRMAGPSFSWTAPSPEEATAAPLRLGLRDDSSRGTVRFRPTVRAGRDGRPRIYLRDDQFSFRVAGPNGEVLCARERLQIVALRDRFRRLGRRQLRTTLDSLYYCPEGTFDAPGVYEVTPILELPHAGTEFGFDALTGVFVGSSGTIRIRTRLYLPHSPPSESLNEETQ